MAQKDHAKEQSYYPDNWLGEWRDTIGRKLFVSRVGKSLEISVHSNLSNAPFPIPGRQGIFTEHLRASFGQVHDFFRLELLGEGLGLGTCLVWDALVEEEWGMRFAKTCDPAKRVLLRPRILPGALPGENPIAFSWAYPLKTFRWSQDK